MPVDQRVIQEQVAAHTQRNAVLVDNIRSKGGDLERKRAIDVLFHTRAEDKAISLSRFLKLEGFCELSITRSDGASDYPWTVQGYVTRSVSDFTAPVRVEWLVGVAAGFGVIYDGWGTALDESPPTI